MHTVPHRLLRLLLPLLLAVSVVPAWGQGEPIAARPFTFAPAALAPSALSQPSTQTRDAWKPDAFADLFRQLGGDFRSLPERQNLLWLGIGGALSATSRPVDRSVSHTLTRSGTLEEALDSGTTVGGTIVQLGAPLLTYVLGRAFDKPTIAHVGGDLFRAQILSQTLTQAVKYSVQRTRPDGTSLSFPSGHSASSFATATVLERHFGWKVGIPAYGVATYVAASRISENRHYLSDVIFGATIGLVAGRTVTVGHGKTQFAISPMASQGAVGVSFTRIASR
jgi:membrane-associated phospholipid phosphatase